LNRAGEKYDEDHQRKFLEGRNGVMVKGWSKEALHGDTPRLAFRRRSTGICDKDADVSIR
jgi:hypothetical protein